MLNVHQRLRILETYAVISGIIFLVLAVSAFVSDRSPAEHFEELSVERISIVEKNGTPRLVIANSTRMPDPIIDGKPFKTERPSGMVFYNQRGDEDGGLIFDAVAKEGGQYGAYGGLSFDQYRQSQIVALTYNDHSGTREAGLHVWDRPETSLTDLLDRRKAVESMPDGAAKTAALKSLSEANLSPNRVFVGKNKNREAIVALSDAGGRPRIQIVVAASGQSRLEFLDDDGKVSYSLPSSRSQ